MSKICNNKELKKKENPLTELQKRNSMEKKFHY